MHSGNSQYAIQIVPLGIGWPHCIGPAGNNNSASRQQIKYYGNLRITRMYMRWRVVVDKDRKPNPVKPQRTHFLSYARLPSAIN
jgi:hypothetical protein